jgi:hypothetical protein
MSQDQSNIKVWNPKKKFTLVSTINSKSGGDLKISQLSNGDIITSGQNGTLKVLNIHSLNSIETNHTLHNMIQISNEYIISYNNNTLCKYYYLKEHLDFNSCIQLESDITSVSNINATSIMSSHINGNIIFYDLKNFQPILYKNITDLVHLRNDELIYIKKIIKFETGELILILNSNSVLILNEFNLDVIYFLEDNSDNSTFIDVFTEENDFNKFYAIYSNGIIKSYEYNSKLYLNNLIFSDTIELKRALHPIDILKENKIKIDHIPNCLILYDNNKIQDGYIIPQNLKFNYELNGICDKNDNLVLSTNYPYVISIYPRDPPTYSLKEINANTSGVELFKASQLSEGIRKILFQPVKFGKIVYKYNTTSLEVEYFKEYDADLEFSVIFDFNLEESIGIYIPFILKDLYDITSEVINLKINIIRTVPWYKKWYSIAIMVFGILAGIYKFIDWIKNDNYIKSWNALKKGIQNCCKCFKYKILCCCFKSEENLLEPGDEKIF